MELPADYVVGFQKASDAEHFAIGDRYDLLLGSGEIAPVRLTTLVGCETDEYVGNDSFVGALATLEQPDILTATKGYYAVRRHQEPQGASHKFAQLSDEPIRFDVETRIAALLNGRMKQAATDAEQRVAGRVAPSLKVQAFQIADGSLRYYARAEWKSGKETVSQHPYTLAAWITPTPTLQILAIETGLPDLLNVVDLGAGRTGIILHLSYGESTKLELAEYRDGVRIESMRELQSISFGE